MLCRSCDWHDPEVYILLVLDIMFAYNALMLLFGTAHCCSLLCGERLICMFSTALPAQPCPSACPQQAGYSRHVALKCS